MFHLSIALILNIGAFLAYYPGVGMNDGLNILHQGMSISNQFPVFYCGLVVALGKIGYAFGNLRISIALYTILQLLFMSILIAGVCTWFWSKPIPKWLKYISSVYLLAEPLIIMYTISMLKDTVFSVLLLIFSLFIYEMCSSEKIKENRNFWILLGTVCIGIVLIRNNGYYMLIPTLIILCIVLPYKKQIMMTIGLIILSILGTNMAMSHFGTEQLFQEVVAIPLQQMAAVVATDGDINEDEASFLNEILPLDKMKEKYNPGSVDALKWQTEGFNRKFLNQHKREFLQTWISMLPQNFEIYVKAYLQETFWYWAPIQKGTVQCFFSIEVTAGNEWLPEFMEKYGIADKPLLPSRIEKPIKQYLSLGNRFFREGICFWIMLLSLVLFGLKTRNKKKCFCYLPIIFLWGTIMIATPTSSSFRYVLVFAYAMPLFFGLLLEEN
jgi:hypothetical protein